MKSTPEFYVLLPFQEHLFNTRYAHGDVADPADYGSPRLNGTCTACGDGLNGRPWLEPRRMRLSRGLLPDILWGAGFSLVVSGEFKAAWQARGLCGIDRWDAPIEITRYRGKRIDDQALVPTTYHYVWLRYDGASIDDQSSCTKRDRGVSCFRCRQSWNGIERVVFEPDSWTGVDLFVSLGLPGKLIVTARVKDMLDENQMSGFKLVPAPDYRFDEAEELDRVFGRG